MKRFITAAALMLASVAGSVTAHEFEIGQLSIDHPMAFETIPTARAGAGYLSITNNGDTADRLLEVRADYPKVGLHTVEEEDGVTKMIAMDSIEVPAGETIELTPGGMHVMFMGLDGNRFEEGQVIPATLVFEHAGEIEVNFNVEARPAHGEEHDHGSAD
ncbi:copper chaperone PCu(A)C [Roseovarius sp. EL26]|uniref:copper chaperone PCu(A)C n=1 Tax=Roseovarius sp. EL26 TaxID=2126672 RepID=UPI000EA3360B|nr:copper chaperone PCu(A)C [Roseovarius sp. EL26]